MLWCVQFQIATVTAKGVVVEPSMSIKTDWMFAEGLRGCTSSLQLPRPSRTLSASLVESSQNEELTIRELIDGNSDETN